MLENVKKLLEGFDGWGKKKEFFDIIAQYYPRSDKRYQEIMKAYNVAKDAFREVLRDDAETRYFEHIRAVAVIVMVYLRVRDHRLIIAALLHDIVEDKKEWTIERVRLEFGDYVAWIVEYLTKPEKDGFPEDKVLQIYHSRFEGAPREFFYIKLADRLHNLLTLWNSTITKRARKIAETRLYYLPYAERHLILLHEIEAAIEELEHKSTSVQ